MCHPRPLFRYIPHTFFRTHKLRPTRGSGCGSVGRAVASETRGPRFESSHRQKIYNICLLSTVYWKDENKEKGGGDCPFKKNYDQLRIDHLLTNKCIDQLFIQFFILGMSKEASEHRFREWHIDNEICICNSYLWINKCKIFVTTAL